MAKIPPAEIENQLAGINKAVVHATRLFRQGVISQEELHGVEMFALEQRMGPLMSTEEYIQARQSGDFEKYEALMNESRTPSKEARENATRKVAAHYIASAHLETPYASYEDQEKWAKKNHEEVSKFIDTTGFGDDADAALVEANIRLNLGEKVSTSRGRYGVDATTIGRLSA